MAKVEIERINREVDFGEKITGGKYPELREFLTRMEESRWQTFVRRRIRPLLRKLRIKND
jgi:hypothetical protein